VEYVCYRRRHYGTCGNNRYVAAGEMGEAVLQTIEKYVLTSEAIEQVVTLSERNDEQDRREGLVKEQKDVEKRIARLLVAIETAGDIRSLTTSCRRFSCVDRGVTAGGVAARAAAARGMGDCTGPCIHAGLLRRRAAKLASGAESRGRCGVHDASPNHRADIASGTLAPELPLQELERVSRVRGVRLTIWNLIALVGFIVPFMSALHTAQAAHSSPLGYAIAVSVGLVIGVISACAIYGMAKLASSLASEKPSLAGKALLVALFPASTGFIVLADLCGGWLTMPLLRMLG
jgi:hypothetical protein